VVLVSEEQPTRAPKLRVATAAKVARYLAFIKLSNELGQKCDRPRQDRA